MTAAISLYEILTKNGHEVSHVIVGKSNRRVLPSFFKKQIHAPITQLESPNFVTDKNMRSVNILKTLTVSLWKYRAFLKGINQINQIVKQDKPDTIINFYDFLGGLFFMLKKTTVKHVVIAHQFLLNHRDFEFPKGRFYDKASLLYWNRLVGYKSSKILAVSFREMEDELEKKIHIVPPLLRDGIKRQSISSENYFLVYLLNYGYYVDVLKFHEHHPEIPVHCFWDKKDEENELKIDDTLTFHRLDGGKFIQKMAGCRGYLTTAGVESVCEAMYMGKPVLMIPVEGHYEQVCNALDAKKSGAGISSSVFNLEILLDYLPHHKDVGEDFRDWCKRAPEIFIKILT